MLVHLLNNAVKFTPEGGQISLHVTGDHDQEVVHFVVQDTGIGIATGDMAQLFKPFVQIDSRLSRLYEGAGLGLAIVARLTELHGGSIAVDSVEGKGSRFTLSLPWRPHSTAEDYSQGLDWAASRALPSEQAPLILLAEDNEATITMLQEYLQFQGYQVVVAHDGAEAIEQARKTHPALIVMDMQMPMLDGLEATRHIRTASDIADIPIILMTALTMPGDRERCLGAGASAYLSKPVSLRTLTRTIEQQLTRQ
jgi:CheY-like chemotaxis protein